MPIARLWVVGAACLGCAGTTKQAAMPMPPQQLVAHGEVVAEAEAAEAPASPQAGPAGGNATTTTTTDVRAPSPIAVREKVVVSGSVRLSVDDGPKAVAELRAFVQGVNGRIVHEELVGRDRSWYGQLRLRLPPDQVTGFLAWLEKQGDIEQRQIEATDVSKEYFDQELALKNLRITHDRLQALLARDTKEMKDVLEVERELGRVRGEIERIEGEHRFLEDRIAWATIEVMVGMRGDVVFAPHAKFHPGPRMSMLFLLDSEPTEEEQRLGGGLTLHLDRAFTVDVDIYPSRGMDERAFVTTLGGAAYSDFLGGGRRRFLNPYLGLRAGYAWLHDHSNFAFGGEVGVELFKNDWVLVDVAGRALAFAHGDGVDPALQVAAGLQIPF